MVAKFFLDLVSLGARFTARAPRCRGPEADLGTLSSFKANSKPRARVGGRSGSTAPKVTRARFCIAGLAPHVDCSDSAETPGTRRIRQGQAKKKQKEESTLGCSATELRRNAGKTFKRRDRHAHVSIKRPLVRIELTK